MCIFGGACNGGDGDGDGDGGYGDCGKDPSLTCHDQAPNLIPLTTR